MIGIIILGSLVMVAIADVLMGIQDWMNRE